MKFSEICTFAVIYAAYLAARRGKRSRAATAHYEVRLLENIVNLVYILKTKIYRPGVFRVFYVYEPKKRLVQAPAFVDKVVQHAIVDNLLYDRITRSFILDNYASQKNKGLHFGLDRLKGFFTDYWNKHHTAEGWVLKCDVRHFFASINHDKLKEKLKKLDLEPVVYDLLCIYIDCSDGLPLGYQTSQLFALLFLDDFDHFVKEQLHIQYLYKKYKQADARQKAVELGVQALLRDRIVQSYYHYEERGWITLHGLENVNAMYKEYHALGGNGTVTALVNTIHELEVRDDKRPASQA